MAIQRAATLYPINTTTVDTGAGIDVRALSDTQPGASDSSQSILNSGQGTNQEKTFDPATAQAAGTTNNAQTTLAKLGYAIPSASMTDGDSNCTTTLQAQTITVSWIGTATGTGTGNVGANDVLTPKASLWKYNTSTDTGTSIASGSGTAVTMSALLAYGPTAYSASVSISVSETSFSTNEVLYVQIGGNLACGAGLLGGARTTTWTLTVDDTGTNLVLGTHGIVKYCTYSLNATGNGTVSRNIAASLSRNSTGAGTPTSSKAVVASKTFSLTGAGSVALTKTVQAQRTFNLTGAGSTTIQRSIDKNPFTLSALGTVTYNKVVIASKSFALVALGSVTHNKAIEMTKNAVGNGTVTNIHPVQAYRTFNLTAAAEILVNGSNGTTITLPIDEVPTTGGGTTIIKRPTYILED